MRPIFSRTCSIALLLVLTINTAFASGASPGKDSRETIASRVIESKTDKATGVTLVIFHQDNNADRSQLGTFLRNHDGASIEFQTASGTWQTASVFRLKSCFGRGLLVLASDRARLAEGDKFLLRSGAVN